MDQKERKPQGQGIREVERALGKLFASKPPRMERRKPSKVDPQPRMTKAEKDRSIRITKDFYDDHRDRDLLSPEIIHETQAHYFIDITDRAALFELHNDADHYAFHMPYDSSITGSARAVVRVIEGYWKRTGAEYTVERDIYLKRLKEDKLWEWNDTNVVTSRTQSSQ